MTYLHVDQIQEQANVLTRLLEYLDRRRGEFSVWCSSLEVRRTDPLNVWIGVRSPFAEQVLGAIGRIVFPSFENRHFVDVDGVRWSHFGYICGYGT